MMNAVKSPASLLGLCSWWVDILESVVNFGGIESVFASGVLL